MRFKVLELVTLYSESCSERRPVSSSAMTFFAFFAISRGYSISSLNLCAFASLREISV
jgi:hypothetical protein